MTERDWQSMFEAAAELGHEELIGNVTELAKTVCGGDSDAVDKLVAAARVLDYRYRTCRRDFPPWLVSTTRLAEMPVTGLAAQTSDDPMVCTMNMVRAKGAPQFVATTAGFIRTTFDCGPTPGEMWLRSMSLATLPGALPQEPTAPVVLYGTLQGGVSSVLSAVRDDRDPQEPIRHLVDRVVQHHPFPWEPGGWNGD
ncbi:hypothetical protein [Saccharopolyspora sp. NPDC002376]